MRAILAARVGGGIGISRADVDTVSSRMIDLIGASLESGEKVKLSGLATLEIRPRAERAGRNANTGDAYPIAARRFAHQVPGAKLRQKLDRKSA